MKSLFDRLTGLDFRESILLVSLIAILAAIGFLVGVCFRKP